jgi:hypothetical protein
VYVLVNGVASAVALLVANILQLSFFGTPSSSTEAVWIRAAVAGLGGVVVIRASIGKHSDPTRAIVRLAQWFENLMDVALAELDDRRLRAAGAPAVNGIMRRVSFAKAKLVLPIYLSASYPDPARATEVAGKVAAIEHRRLAASSDRAKSILLGTELAKVYSAGHLRAAVQSLGEDIRR